MDDLPELIDVSALATELRRFAAERDWDKFHTPRNLAMALAGEVGELLAEMQWRSNAEIQADDEARARIALELADVTSYLVRLADVLGIDLSSACALKLLQVQQRYRAEDISGSAEKR